MMKKAFISTVAVLLLAACAENVSTSDGLDGELTFCVSNAPLTTTASITRSSLIESDYEVPLYMMVTSEPVSNNLPTRGTEVTTDGLNASGKTLGVSAFSGSTVQSWCDGRTATFNTSDNLFHTGVNWSSQSGDYDFYVWHPLSGSGLTVSGKTITYNIASLASSAMPDLLGAKVTTNYTANHGRVDVTLGHLLTPVCFKLAADYGGGTIKSISFSSLVTAATQVIGTGTWSASTTGAYTTQTLSTTGTTTEVQVDGSEYFMMIPQTIAAGTIITITTEKGGNTYTLKYTTPSNVTWNAGETITYTISTNTLTSLSVEYPLWKVDASTNVLGPVVRYETGETFGLFAVDEDGKIAVSNLPVEATLGSTTATCDLTTGTNASNVSNYILSKNYTYYLMYPYQSSGIPAALEVGENAPGNTADTFFDSVVSNWSVSTTQNTIPAFKAQDLQIAKATVSETTANAKMAHKMGIAKITLGTTNLTASEVRTYSSQTTTHDVYSSSTSTTAVTATSRLDETSASRLLDASGGYWTIVKATGENSNTSVTLNSVTSDADAWQSSVTVTTAGYGKYINNNVLSSRTTGLSFVANFEYNTYETYYQITLDAGTYKLEVWGAQGGDGREWNTDVKVEGAGGKGGYTCGTLTLASTQTLYVCVGGKGEWAWPTSNDNPPGGFNGGGKGGTENEGHPENAGGGGGATHIASELRGTGILSAYKNNKSDVLIVAGGGGGASGCFPAGTVNGNYSVTSEDLSGLASYNWFANYQLEDNPRASYQAVYGGDGGSTGAGTTYHYGNSGNSGSRCGVIPCSAPGVADGGNDNYFGQGQDGCTHPGNHSSSNIGGTGGGGGGWYGGTYGGQHHNQVSAAGAGGSGHVSRSLTNPGGIVGENSGNGKARITKL